MESKYTRKFMKINDISHKKLKSKDYIGYFKVQSYLYFFPIVYIYKDLGNKLNSKTLEEELKNNK